MLKVVGGQYRGRKLRLIKTPLVRPMTAKLRGALFNMLGDRVKDAVVLDGFAGTGAIGLEALSRGARTVVFIDEYYPAAKTIKDNLAKCEADDRGRVVHQEFNRAVIRLSKEEAQFDLIFLDPPYKLLEERNPLKVLSKRGVMNPGGVIVLRRHVKIRRRFPEFRLEREVRIGDDVLMFYVNDGDSGPGPEAPGSAP